MAFNLAFRHYYSEVDYAQFYNLQQDGELVKNSSFEGDYNTTFNSWNLDLRFSWWFAPGSQATLLYRNAVDSYLQESRQNFSQNFNYLFDQPMVNSISLRVSYFLDYNRAKTWFSSKPDSDEDRNLNRKTGKTLQNFL